MELWEPIKGFEDYMISSLGRVMSLRFGRKIMKPGYTKLGYAHLTLMDKKEKHSKRIHRLVGEAFLPPVEGKTTIDHIDRNPGNNRVENLRWANLSEQSINRNAYSNSHHKNISRSKLSGWFHVVIKRNKTVMLSSAHPTLEEAIFYRDSFLATENVETV